MLFFCDYFAFSAAHRWPPQFFPNSREDKNLTIGVFIISGRWYKFFLSLKMHHWQLSISNMLLSERIPIFPPSTTCKILTFLDTQVLRLLSKTTHHCVIPARKTRKKHDFWTSCIFSKPAYKHIKMSEKVFFHPSLIETENTDKK